jgi:hypothetical protein
VSRTASTGFAPEPFPFEPDDRFRLLAAPLVDRAAGLDFFVELALVDFDLGDELGRAEVDRFFV